MQPDDHVCLCFHVSLGKIRAYLRREDPQVASLISECLSAGTGCGWCVPFLRRLHRQHREGLTPDLPFDPEAFAAGRVTYRTTGERSLEQPGEPNDDGPPGGEA